MSTILLSGLPFNCLETDIHRALLVYGTAVDIRIQPQYQQAYVTMRSHMEAHALLQRKAIMVLGNTVRVDSVTPPPTAPPPAVVSPQPQNALLYGTSNYAHQQQQQQQQQPQQQQAPPQLYQTPTPYGTQQTQPTSYSYQAPQTLATSSYPQLQPPQQVSYQGHQTNGGGMGGGNSSGGYGQSVFPSPPPQHQSNSIYPAPNMTKTSRLRVVVEDCKVPITRDVMVEMFNMVDKPLHVFCSPSGPTTTGDVEFATVEAAERAMAQFNNKNVYPNCCLLRLSYVPPRETNAARGYHGGTAGQDGSSVMPARPTAYGSETPAHAGSRQAPPPPPPPAGMHPGMMLMGAGRGGRGRGIGRGGLGRGGGADRDGFTPFHASHPTSGAVPTPPFLDRRGPFPGPHQAAPNDVTVMVSNVSENVPLYDLWVLLEVFGNVNSLKRQFKEKTNVTAQFQHPPDAKAAVFFLHGCPFRGKVLALKLFAGYVERAGGVEWNAGPATDPATQACLFTAGYHHRTKPSAPFNPLGRIRPDKNIFVSNLIEAITDDAIQAEFTKAGVVVEGYYRKDALAAIVGFKDTEAAIDALVGVHGKQLKDRYLRLTFSRFPPGPRDDSTKGDEHGAEHNEEEISRALNEVKAEARQENGGEEEDASDHKGASVVTAGSAAETSAEASAPAAIGKSPSAGAPKKESAKKKTKSS